MAATLSAAKFTAVSTVLRPSSATLPPPIPTALTALKTLFSLIAFTSSSRATPKSFVISFTSLVSAFFSVGCLLKGSLYLFGSGLSASAELVLTSTLLSVSVVGVSLVDR